MKPIKLAITLATYPGYVVPGHGLMWITLGGALKQFNERFTLVGYMSVDVCGVSIARNILLAHAMELDADWALMVDSDTWVDNGATLLRMIAHGIEAEATIVGAPVYKRDGKLAVFRMEGEKAVSMEVSDLKDGLVEVEAIGAACMAISLRNIGDAAFTYTDKNSEDLEFCRQIREQGGKIFVDTRVQTKHLGKGQPIIFEPKAVK